MSLLEFGDSLIIWPFICGTQHTTSCRGVTFEELHAVEVRSIISCADMQDVDLHYVSSALPSCVWFAGKQLLIWCSPSS